MRVLLLIIVLAGCAQRPALEPGESYSASGLGAIRILHLQDQGDRSVARVQYRSLMSYSRLDKNRGISVEWWRFTCDKPSIIFVQGEGTPGQPVIRDRLRSRFESERRFAVDQLLLLCSHAARAGHAHAQSIGR